MARKLKRIELLKPHEHAGREYPAGTVMELEVVAMDMDSAAWLITMGVAKDADAPMPSTEPATA